MPLISETDLILLRDWALLNKDRFTPNGFGRQYGNLETLDAPDCWKTIKAKIVAENGNFEFDEEPMFGNYCGFITEGGSIHPHTDENVNGKMHTRFNVVLSKPYDGGLPINNGIVCALPEEGDYFVTYSGRDEHACTVVSGNKPRIVMSLGCLIDVQFNS